MGFEFGHVADPPDVVADAVVIGVTGVHFASGDFFAQHDCLLHGTVAETAAAHVVGFAAAGGLVEMPERVNQVCRMNVVAHLFAFVAENAVFLAGDGAFHQIGQEAVQFGGGMAGAGEAAAADQAGFHAEIFAVFLHHDIGGDFRRAEERMFAMVNGHGFVNAAREIWMGDVNFPAGVEFDQRQQVGIVAVDFIGRSENEHRAGAELARGFEHIEGAVGVDAEVGERFAGCPVMRRLGGGMDHQFDVASEIAEDIADGAEIADVGGFRGKVRVIDDQFGFDPFGGCVVAEEVFTHIIVNADDIESLIAEKPYSFRTDQPV